MRGQFKDEQIHRESNTLYLSKLKLVADNAGEYMDAIEKFQPVFIEANPSAIALLALWLKDNGREARLKNLKSVLCSSEPVRPWFRDLIREVFGCPVVDMYHNSEQVAMISQCRHGTYHENEEYSYVEYIDIDGKNVSSGFAEIVGTGFVNYALPMIRYRTLDIAEISGSDERCKCGRTRRKIEFIAGRTRDYLEGRNAERITDTREGVLYRPFDGVLQFQYFQNTPGRTVIRVVTAREVTGRFREEIIREAERRTSGAIDFTLEIMKELEKGPIGRINIIVKR